jgi:uncharacterized membrane protein
MGYGRAATPFRREMLHVLSLSLAIAAVTMHRMSRFVALTIVVVILGCTVVAYAQSLVTAVPWH